MADDADHIVVNIFIVALGHILTQQFLCLFVVVGFFVAILFTLLTIYKFTFGNIITCRFVSNLQHLILTVIVRIFELVLFKDWRLVVLADGATAIFGGVSEGWSSELSIGV